MKSPSNVFASIPADLLNEFVEVLQAADNVRIERIVSLGYHSPDGFWFDQESDEWVLLLQGKARLRFEGDDTVELKPGGHINIPAHKRHRVEWTTPSEPTVWLAVHYGDVPVPTVNCSPD